MAASQARLLSITARQHDVEYKAQAIQNAKIQLATQQDRVYQEYQEALDAQTLTLTSINTKSGEKSTVAATFNNLFSHNRLTPAVAAEYALFDRNGRLVVEDDIYQRYYDFIDTTHNGLEKTPQAFALYMLFGNNVDWDNAGALYAAENNAYINRNLNFNEAQQERLQELRESICEMLGSDVNDPAGIYDTNAVVNDTDFNWEEYNKQLNEYLAILYSGKGGDHIYKELKALSEGGNIQDPEYSSMTMDPDFTYYMHMFQAIQSAGGCVSIETFDGFNGNAANDSEWLTNMISSGLMSISTIDVDKKGNISFNGTSPSSDESINYTTTSTIDSTAVKKAEAKYEHELKQINRKDKKFDLDLSKLDTERNALKTEYDSVKKVIEDNIDRSFGIFS